MRFFPWPFQQHKGREGFCRLNHSFHRVHLPFATSVPTVHLNKGLFKPQATDPKGSMGIWTQRPFFSNEHSDFRNALFIKAF